jgi:hypothetical protein
MRNRATSAKAAMAAAAKTTTTSRELNIRRRRGYVSGIEKNWHCDCRRKIRKSKRASESYREQQLHFQHDQTSQLNKE